MGLNGYVIFKFQIYLYIEANANILKFQTLLNKWEEAI